MASQSNGGQVIDPVHHFELHPLVEIHLFGIDFSITQAVVWIWIAVIVLFTSLALVARTLKYYPSGAQNFVEMIVEFLRSQLVNDVMGEKEGRTWFPFIATIFLFVLTSSLLGLVPGSFTPTANINVTTALALVVFLAVQGVGVRKHGLGGYLKGFVPHGIPLWVLPLLLPIEFISQLAKPLSLAIRLFANMLVGHVVILVFLSMIILFKSFIVAVFPMAGVVVMSAFEIFVASIQAFIFAILTANYISDAIHQAH